MHAHSSHGDSSWPIEGWGGFLTDPIILFVLYMHYSSYSIFIAYYIKQILQDCYFPPSDSQVWNDELAQLAQNYAEMCNNVHNSDRHDQSSSFTFVGENLAATTALDNDYVRLVQLWYDEVQYFTHGTGCEMDQVCGHYTQVNSHLQ